MDPLQIGVCTWSIDRHDPVGALATIRDRLGLGVAQVGFFGRAAIDSADAERIRAAAGEARIELAATFVGYDDQDYSSIEAITRTGGFMPDEHWTARLELTLRAAKLTQALELNKLGIHVGTLPPDRNSPAFSRLVERTQRAADGANEHGVTLLIETGPDPADLLTAFLDALARPNVQINFDPANIVAYGSGDPVQAVAHLRGRIALVHVKDALASKRPGADWGGEAFPGSGEADIPRVVSKLRATGYRGPLLIERRTGGGIGDIPECVEYLRSLIGSR